MENTFRDAQSLSENGMGRGDQREKCSPREKFKLRRTPHHLSRLFVILLVHNSPCSLGLATKERKASLIVCGDLRSTARSKKISTPMKLSRSKSASHFKAKRRPKSSGLALERP